jgi:hypothetical protein
MGKVQGKSSAAPDLRLKLLQYHPSKLYEQSIRIRA